MTTEKKPRPAVWTADPGEAQRWAGRQTIGASPHHRLYTEYLDRQEDGVPEEQRLYARALETRRASFADQDRSGDYTQAVKAAAELDRAGGRDMSIGRGAGGRAEAANPFWTDKKAAKKEYWALLERNMAVAAADPDSVTPEMTAELEAAWQASRGSKADLVGRSYVGGVLTGTANAANDFTNRALMGEPVAELSPERLSVDPQKQEDIDEVWKRWKAGLQPGEFEALEYMGQLPTREAVYANEHYGEAAEKQAALDLSRRYTWDEPYLQETQERYKDAPVSGGVQFAVDLAAPIGNMTPAMAFNAIPVVGPALSSAYFFSSASGGAVQQALDAGATNEQAMKYGTSVGAVEMLTEKFFDGMAGMLGKGTADNVVESVVKKVVQNGGGKWLQNLTRLSLNAAGEGVEEGLSGLIEPLLQTIYNNKTVQESFDDLDWNELLYQVILGFCTGNVLGSAGFVNGEYEAKNRAIENEIANEALTDFFNTPEGAEWLAWLEETKAQSENAESAGGEYAKTDAVALQEAMRQRKNEENEGYADAWTDKAPMAEDEIGQTEGFDGETDMSAETVADGFEESKGEQDRPKGIFRRARWRAHLKANDHLMSYIGEIGRPIILDEKSIRVYDKNIRDAYQVKLEAAKPHYARSISSWIERGGTIEISVENGALKWTYTAENGMSASYINDRIVFNQTDMHPSSSSINIGEFSGNSRKDRRTAERMLKDLGVDLTGYTLHHGYEMGEMQLIKTDVHKMFTHYGGHAALKSGYFDEQ